MNVTKKATVIIAAFTMFCLSSPSPTAAADGAIPRLGIDSAVMQEQNAELEAARLHQIRSALEIDFLSKYRVYIRAVATGDPMVAIPYPNWALSSTPNDPKANFRYLLDNYLPDLKDQIAAMSKLTGVPEDNFYEIHYVPPVAGEPLPAPGHVVIKRFNAPIATQGRLRGLLPSVTLENVGSGGIISMRINAPSTYLGSEALNASLVRNNGLTLDPVLAAELSSPTGGPDMTFIPGTIVTFGQKGTNAATAAAQGEANTVVFPPTIKFKGADGNVIGVNLMEMEQAAGDPVSRLMFKRAIAPGESGVQTNYIRFEDTRGEIIGVNNIYRRDGADGKTGNNLELAIWAQFHTGGDMVILSPGDTVNGEINSQNNIIKFGLGNRARVYVNDAGELRIESEENMKLKAKKISIEGDLDFAGNVIMRNGLNMSGTNITNVGNISAGSANIAGNTTTGSLSATGQISGGNIYTAGNANVGSLTIAGKTGNSSANAYNVWVANATYSANAGLLGGKAEGSLNVNYANSAGSAGFATNAGNLNGIGSWTALKNYIDGKASSSSMTPDWDAAVSRSRGTTYTAATNGYVVANDMVGGRFYVNGRLLYHDGGEREPIFISIGRGDSYLHSGNPNADVGGQEFIYLWVPAK